MLVSSPGRLRAKVLVVAVLLDLTFWFADGADDDADEEVTFLGREPPEAFLTWMNTFMSMPGAN